MLNSRSPHEAYRRVDFDARVEGANPGELVRLCYEQLTGALGTAIYAHEHEDNRLKSQSLTRWLAAITALQLGVDNTNQISSALNHLYQAARRTILDASVTFDVAKLSSVRQDFLDIAQAMQPA